jgi:F420 biosynthesis protein FbiB-like protein
MVTSDAEKEKLSRRMGERWRAELLADNNAPEVVEQRVSISHSRMTSAGAIVVVCLTMEDMDVYPDPIRNQAEREMAIQSVALSCQNMLLAAHALGLGACWMCAPLFVPDLVRTTLGLPPQWEPQALITLGYPAKGHSAAEKVKEREPLERRMLWR